jgi:hypothetical protein
LVFFALLPPRLAPWAVFFRRFAAFALPLPMGDCIGSISKPCRASLDGQPMAAVPTQTSTFLNPNDYL